MREVKKTTRLALITQNISNFSQWEYAKLSSNDIQIRVQLTHQRRLSDY